jgi:hypothetical protein
VVGDQTSSAISQLGAVFPNIHDDWLALHQLDTNKYKTNYTNNRQQLRSAGAQLVTDRTFIERRLTQTFFISKFYNQF